jgi:hypothetical protein
MQRVWVRDDLRTGFSWRDLRQGDHLEDPDVDGRIILKLIFERLGGGINWIDLAQDRDTLLVLVNVVINKLSVSTKCGEFLEQLRTCQLLRKVSVPCSQLISNNCTFCSLILNFITFSLCVCYLLMT